MSHKIGKILDGKYEIIKLIGEGGMGAVYEANHILIERRFAVKFLHSQYVTSEEVITRFHREATAAGKIGHENIIEVTDMGKDDDQSPYIIMEYLNGCDLKQLIESNKVISVKRTAHIIIQALSALQAAHDVGIIHRDLKPENIYLIEKSGNPDYVKLLDFGISKFKELEIDNVKALTQTGTVLGTPHYMSPEQAKGEQDLSLRSDIYAMGVILYQMLTGSLPFDAPNYNALLLKILTENPARPEDLNPDLPSEVVSIIDRAMDRDPSLRFESCDAFRLQLLPFAPGLTDSTSRLGTNSQTAIRKALYQTKTPFEMSQSQINKKAKTSKLPLILGVAAALVLVAVLSVVLVLESSEDDTAPINIPVVAANPQPTKVEAIKAPSQDTSMGAEKPSNATIELDIIATPAEAQIKIDGVIAGKSPFNGSFVKGDALRTIEIYADGYKSHKELVKFKEDLNLVFELEPKSEKKISRRKRKTSKISPSKPVVTEMKKPSSPVTKPNKKDKKPAREIDKDSPW